MEAFLMKLLEWIWKYCSNKTFRGYCNRLFWAGLQGLVQGVTGQMQREREGSGFNPSFA